MREASHNAATQPMARKARLPASSIVGTPVTAIRIGMMIGDEIGTSDRTLAVVPVGFRSTGWMKTPVLTIMIINGLAACRASLSLLTEEQNAAKRDELKTKPSRKRRRKT